MADDQIVESTTVSPESGTVAPEAGTLPEEPPQPQPLTEEQEARVAQLVTEQLEAAKETGRREMQGKKDREVAEAQRRARFAEDSLGRVRGKYSELDPEARQTLENEDLQAELSNYRTREAQEAAEKQQVAFVQALNASLLEHLNELGIDPYDKRIDWASNATDYIQFQSRFNKSVAKIIKEDKSKVHQDADDKLAKERKEQGLDSVDTSIPVGGGLSDAEFIKKFGSGELPSTKENIERVNKIQKSYE